jgi:hypothetical protein
VGFSQRDGLTLFEIDTDGTTRLCCLPSFPSHDRYAGGNVGDGGLDDDGNISGPASWCRSGTFVEFVAVWEEEADLMWLDESFDGMLVEDLTWVFVFPE